MNICDHHMGAIAMRVSCIVICFVHCAVRECIRLGSHAIAAASACESFHREGPPQVINRPCRLRPTAAASEIRRGCIYYHLIRASTRQVVSEQFMQIQLAERDDRRE